MHYRSASEAGLPQLVRAEGSEDVVGRAHLPEEMTLFELARLAKLPPRLPPEMNDGAPEIHTHVLVEHGEADIAQKVARLRGAGVIPATGSHDIVFV